MKCARVQRSQRLGRRAHYYQCQVVAELDYGIKLGYGFNAMLILATQLTGFSLAGLVRRFLVWPASLVWPQNLIICTLLNTLHAEEEDARGGVSRFKFFCYAAIGSFFWFFLPGRPVLVCGAPVTDFWLGK